VINYINLGILYLKKNSMNLVDRYILKQLFTNSLLILIFIVSVFCLAKSVQLIELMISRNLPSLVFFQLILNSIPQIIPVLIPIILSLSIFFVYSRMTTDQELIILQSSSFSNLELIKPSVFFGITLALISSFFTFHQTPESNKNFKILLYTIKNDYSSSLLQEGVFNSIGKDFTIFIKESGREGLKNIFIHDTRDVDKPSTLIAKKGKIINTKTSTKIFLEEGSQQFQSKDKNLSVLYFDEYLLNISQNKSDNFLNRWKSPSERSMSELRNPNLQSLDDKNNLQAFKAEITMRYSIPLNAISFSLLVVSFLLSFKFTRIDNILRVIKIFSLIIILQIFTIISSNISIKFESMHFFNFVPSIISFIITSFILIKSKRLVNVKK
jgi:lipopolysaccharide export system permease protein